MEVPLFCFSEKDVSEALSRHQDGASSQQQSELEQILCKRWDRAMENGIFRYDLSGVVTRQVPGSFGFVVQCNPKRYSHRRSPAIMHSLKQDFDPSRFNFNQINPEEVLFEVCRVSCSGGDGGKVAVGPHHLMVVNVSPITRGHCLLIPDPKSCLPQVLTEDSIQLCLEMIVLSNYCGFCVVANSLLAYASVNHLHYHILNVEESTLSATIGGCRIGASVFALTDHPAPGFGFQLERSTQDTAGHIFKVVQLLLDNEIPHNMVILRGKPFESHLSCHQIVRVLLIPRKAFYGEKMMKSEKSSKPPFCAAACELAQGFIPVLDEAKYETLTEPDILQILKEQMLTEDEFLPLLDKTKCLFQ